jgi:hypothetical protein
VTVAQIGALQGRYQRLADRFKAIWTYHHFASGTFRNFLGAPLPYDLDFKAIGAFLRDTPTAASLDAAELALDGACQALLVADDCISTSLLRRFFERLKQQDDAIVECLIKFYLYCDAVDGDRRDKLDFLFTRIGGERIGSLELRERVIELVAARRASPPPPRAEVGALIRAIGTLRDDIAHASTFDELTQRNLLKNARTFKHRVGALYFDPDVLLAIVELNVAARDRFAALYELEEARLVSDSEKLFEHGDAIERNFGDANPDLVDEMVRFRGYKERFDSLRAQSNVKHDVIARLKTSMATILAQLDRGAGPDEVHVEEIALPDPAIAIGERFGTHEPLLRFLVRIAAAVDAGAERELRLEPWEAAAYRKLVERESAETDEETEELWMLFLRAAALRIKVDEEATILATSLAASVKPEHELLAKAKRSLDSAKELDEAFADLLQEAVVSANPKILRQLYRSRFRLLRGFSGLWLIYDQQS